MINYSIQEISNYIRGLDFIVEDAFTSESVDTVISAIDGIKFPYEYEIGATKLVIIPKTKNYVIKIPFNGEIEYSFLEDNWVFYPFCGADVEPGDNYCESEISIYSKAEKAGFGDLFMPLNMTLIRNSFSVYVQEKCELFCISNKKGERHSTKESIEKLQDGIINGSIKNYDFLPHDWLGSCLDVLKSCSKLANFLDFLREEKIVDLHTSNIGYFNNHAVIVDYGGYFE